MFKVGLLTLTNAMLPLSDSNALHIPNSLLTVLILSRQTARSHVHFTTVLTNTHLNNSLLQHSIIFQSLQKSLILLITYKHTILHSISVKGLFWKFCSDVHGGKMHVSLMVLLMQTLCISEDTSYPYHCTVFCTTNISEIFVQLFPSSLSLFSLFEF